MQVSTPPPASVQRVKVDDIDETEAETWDNVSYVLFEVRGIAEDHRDDAEDIFYELGEDAEFEYYDEVADEVEMRLCSILGVEYPLGDHDDGEGDDDPVEEPDVPQRARGAGGPSLLLKLLIGYLAIGALVRGAEAQPSGPITGGYCTVDPTGGVTCDTASASTALAHVRCDPLVMNLCNSTAVANPVFDGLLSQVDSVCASLTIREARAGPGTCVFKPSGADGGEISCDTPSGYDDSSVGHELEHAYDYCRSDGMYFRSANNLVQSEIHAHTVQAAIAKVDLDGGKQVASRHKELAANFDAGCPEPTKATRLDNVSDGLYAIIHMYHLQYVGDNLSLATLVATYSGDVGKAVARYKDMTTNKAYGLARDRKYKKKG